VVLIFAQAMADLKLPDLMSNIVNTGIQNKGIESAAVDVLSEDTFLKLTEGGYYEIGVEADGTTPKITPILSPSDIALIKNTYTPKDAKDAPKKLKLKSDASGTVYVRKDIIDKKDKVDEGELEAVFNKGFLYLFSANISEQILKAYGAGQESGSLSGTISEEQLAQMLKLFEDLKALNVLSQSKFFYELLADNDLLTVIQMVKDDAAVAAFSTPLYGIISAVNTMLSSNELLAGNIPIQQAVIEVDKAGVDTAKVQSGYIWFAGLIMLLVALGSAVCTIAVGFFAAKVAARLSRDLRKKLFVKVESFSNHEIDKFTSASLITRSTNDISQIQQLIMFMLRMVFYAPMIGFGAVYYVLTKAPTLVWLNFLSVGILVLMVALMFIIALPRFKLVQKLIDKLNLITREDLSGMMVIRAFNKQETEAKRFDKANNDLTKVNLFINRIMILMMPVMTLLMSGLSIAIIWIGADKIIEGSMKVGDMMAFIQYTMQIVMSFLMIAVMFIMVPRASVAAKRISDVLETDPIIKDREQTTSLFKKAAGRLEFQDVDFKYESAEENAVSGISFTASPGKILAIIGTTGSGKSTIVNLMPRFYDVTGGTITIDGTDIRDLTLKELRSNISIVPQKSLLFSGTVATNLELADPNATEEQKRNALATAQILEFVDKTDGGIDMNIAQGGHNVSGGQKQRLSIARALAKDAPILVFDDSFSALDFKTDAKLRRALKTTVKDKTIIIVAQRIGTIKDADEIIVLDEGKIVGKGTHAYLMENCEAYREIAYSQLQKEELL
jgi:ATP-binding cassette subfamily B protein